RRAGKVARAARGEAPRSLQRDRLLDRVRQPDRADGDGRLGGQLFVALEAAVRERLPHRLLDLALGGDAESLEKFADADVEGVLVHGSLSLTAPAHVPAKWIPVCRQRTCAMRNSGLMAARGSPIV